MLKFSVDFEKLEDKLLKRSFKLSEVKDKIEKVAFDVVRFKDSDDTSKLWQVQSADDGEYIVVLYEDNDSMKKQASKSDWEVTFNKNSQTVNFYYKGDPLVKMSSSELGIPQSEIAFAQRYLPSKLAQNRKLVKALLSKLSETTKNSVLSKYPELA